MNKLILAFVFISILFTSCNNSTEDLNPNIPTGIYEPIDRTLTRFIVTCENGVNYYFNTDYGIDTLRDLKIQPIGSDYRLNFDELELDCRKIQFKFYPVGTYVIAGVAVSGTILDPTQYSNANLAGTKVIITENTIKFEGLDVTPTNIGVVHRYYQNGYEHLITNSSEGDLRIYIPNSKGYPTRDNVEIIFK